MLDSTLFLCCLLSILTNILESLKLELYLVSKSCYTNAFLSSSFLKFLVSSSSSSRAGNTDFWLFLSIGRPYHLLLLVGLLDCIQCPYEADVYKSLCCILTFDPGKYAIPKWCTGRKWHIPMASNRKKSRKRDLADEMGQGKKFPWYTHRLMHRKRVTCELHDSYFRLMTIKHAIPRIEWAIEWTLNYYITQSRHEVRDQLELETRCGRESHTRPKGPSGAPWWVGVQRSWW